MWKTCLLSTVLLAACAISDPDSPDDDPIGESSSDLTCWKWGYPYSSGYASCNACGASPTCAATQYGTVVGQVCLGTQLCTLTWTRTGTIKAPSNTFYAATSWNLVPTGCTYGGINCL